ncbi:MAG: outer membrane lipoprotein LolB [Betaproteobacteria bacterium]|nr:outer membrane lipoprotein LolB [Betaproteobacteria bacterium]
MSSRYFAWIILLLALSLGGCATTQTPLLPQGAGRDDFSLTGRVLVRQAEKADVLRVTWQHVSASDRVSLETPLGQTLAKLELDPDRAYARLGDGREFQFSDDTLLAQELLGAPLPLRRFAHWVRAEPGRDTGEVVRDQAQRVLAMRDLDWQLSYSGYGDLTDTPNRPTQVEARNGDITVRLRIEEWAEGSSGNE